MLRNVSRIVLLCISACYFSMRALWKACLRVLGCRVPGDGVVLCYHAVPSTHVARFSWQMKMLRRYCTPVSPDYKGGVPANERFAAVTFDDGHRSVLENALPILRRDRIPCAIFFITEWFGLSAPWAHQEGYEAQDTYLTQDDLPQLPTDLVIVGSHTATHPRLPTISGNQRLAELTNSRRCLQRLAHRQVGLFAFPFGALNSGCLREAANVGYQRVFTVEPKAAFKRSNEFVTGRVVADPWDWKVEFLLKLQGAYNWRSKLFALRDRIRVARGAAERLTVPEEESIRIEAGDTDSQSTIAGLTK